MMLGFYGMKLANTKTGEIERTTAYLSRYRETLINRSHNQLRVRRILTHLNNVGFRPFAINLVKHFEREIYGVKKFDHYISLPYLDRQIYLAGLSDAPLKELAGKRQCYETWKIYGDYGDDVYWEKALENNCYMSVEEMKSSVYFRLMRFLSF